MPSGIRDFERHMALWLVVFVLAGCSASQSSTPSVPRPPEPPAQASIPGTPSEIPSTEAGAPAEDPESTNPSTAGEAGTESNEAGAEPTGGEAAMNGGATTSGEQRAALDGELDESLREFDGLILKEQELLDKRREETGVGGSAASGGATGAESEAGAGGTGGYGELGEEGTEESEAEMAGGTGGSPDAPDRERPEGSPSGDASDEIPAGATDNGRVPPDVGDGHDDDIVARQLREAAMKEEDPELRERLWDEYRAYKKGTKS